MKKLADLTFILGSLAMLTALVLRAADMRQAAVIFLCGSILAAIGRLAAYRQPDDITLKRLKIQQVIASLLFIGCGALMMSDRPGNEWIGCLCIATIFETYSVFRISSIEKHK